jgi:tRNA-dihydrouridine synthase B
MLKIGNINLPGTLALSPMAGVTDAPFRQIARQNGADYAISEMITSQLTLWHTDKTQRRLQDPWETAPRIIQIAGATPDVVVAAAIKCEQMGVDLLEINMGCPAKKVCNVLAGSALLKDEALVQQILQQTTKAVAIPVMLKTRLGWDLQQTNILTIAKIAEAANVKAITIHGRTRSELYNGGASYDLIAAVKQAVEVPIFANGDITTPEKAKYVLDYTKADGLYIGRGALGKPWLFQQIKDYLAKGSYINHLTGPQIKTLIKQHLHFIYQHYDEYMGCRIARKHVKWYLPNLTADTNWVQHTFKEFSQIEASNEQLDFLDQIFTQQFEN